MAPNEVGGERASFGALSVAGQFLIW